MADVKTVVTDAQKSSRDGALGISKDEYARIKGAFRNDPQSAESVKWLQQKQPQLYAALTSDLDYSGYTGTAIGSLNSTRSGIDLAHDADKRAANLDKLPPLEDFDDANGGMPKGIPGGDPLPVAEDGQKVTGYKTGPNYTMVKGDALRISDADARASRKAQDEMCTKMSGVIGADVANPPSVNAAKGYFQALADRGASQDEIKSEYGKYLQTFYKHPGGVTWNPKLDPKDVNARFQEQPVAKDGKRLIDCEGYAALTENVLGGLKKNGQPMFDIQHGQSAEHVVAGVFPHGGDPTKGFVVDNDTTRDVKVPGGLQKDYDKTKDTDARQRFLVREHMRAQGEALPTKYGATYGTLTPPTRKVK